MSLYFVLALSIAAALWLGWRYFALRRDILALTHQIRSDEELVESSPDLGELASAVNARLSTFDVRFSTSEKERAKLSAILDQLTDAVLIADADGRVQFANPAAEKLFGSPLAGRSVVETVRHHQLADAWRRCRETGETQTESVEVPASRHFLQLIVVPDRDTRGGTLLLVQDLTRVRRLETVRRDFISNLSHELRTPLASLKALTETLQDGALTDPEAAPRFLNRIHTEVDALTQMAQELLDLSKIESEQVELVLREVNPLAVLQSAAERLRVQAERAGVSLTLEETAVPPNVRGDAARLEQALVNLIHNAVKFTPRGGSVTLSAKVEGESVVFAVRDTGIGIPSDDLPRIFERFYRVDKSRAGSGTGLGLSIARHIVEAHGGKIWAESREGEGSVFCFSIPRGR
ncbi:MAG: ATP-binding protein [Anaerolineales bacterium]|nr:ATP-binding protein [Anaerolineales bacterium]NUQ84530.1 PAS domain-containing protein [Anaerolineales bacterium]